MQRDSLGNGPCRVLARSHGVLGRGAAAPGNAGYADELACAVRAVTQRNPVFTSLTYMSSARHHPTQAEMDHLLLRARSRNEREEVTGLLLFAEGRFMQVIEGPPEGVARVYAAIMADPLHHDILELLQDTSDRREFGRWTMAYRAVGLDTAEPDDELGLALAVPPGELSAARHLLSAFWTRGLAPRSLRATGPEPLLAEEG